MARARDDVAFQMLKQDIKTNTPGRLYIFYGEEMFLQQHYLQRLQKVLVDELTESFNYTRLNNENFELQTFVDAVERFPMMAETTMVQVDDVDLFKLPEAEREKLAQVLADIPQYCSIVFTYETVVWKLDKRYKNLCSVIEEHGLVVEFQKQEQRDLIAWIQRHFAARQKSITPELCAYLIELTGGTMTALSGEIGKIAAFSGTDQICRADIDAVTVPVLDAVVFQMTDLLGQGKYGQALLKLQTLLKMQQEPIAILGAVGSHFRRISTARILLDHGKQAGELMKLYNLRDYAARKTMETARHFSAKFCAKASQLIVETDYKMKTSFDTQERLLELLILQLAQEAQSD